MDYPQMIPKNAIRESLANVEQLILKVSNQKWLKKVIR